MHDAACPDLGAICRTRDVEPYRHDQGVAVGELRLVLEPGLTDWLSWQLQLPLKLIATDITYRRLDGTVFVPEEVGIHHRDETLLGPTDPMLAARAGTTLAGYAIRGGLGVTLPLGRTEPNPFRLGHEGLAHQHLQFGAGVVAPAASLEIMKDFGWLWGLAYGQAVVVPWANRHGFQQGHRFSAGLQAGGTVPGDLRLSGGLDVVHEEPERWDGVVQQDGNLGRTDLLLGVGVAYRLGEQLVGLQVRTPVWQRVVGGQVSYPALVSVTVERTFGGAGREK